MKGVLILLTFVVFLETFATGQCPNSTWKHLGNRCYFVKAEEADFFENIALCNHLNASLVSITSEEENIEVTQLATIFRGHWLGLGHKGNASKDFYWLDGRPYIYNSWGREPVFINDKYWAAYFFRGQWGDSTAFDKYIQMCAIDLKANSSIKKTPNPSELKVDQVDQTQCPNTAWRKVGNKCIFLDKTKEMTYMQNQALCRELNATMVSIHSEAENIQISRLVAGGQFWIGMKQVSRMNRSYEWEDRSRMNYQSWWKEEPRDLGLKYWAAYSSRGLWYGTQGVYPKKPCCQISLVTDLASQLTITTRSIDAASKNTESPSDVVAEGMTELPLTPSTIDKITTTSKPETTTPQTENGQKSDFSDDTNNLIQLLKDAIGKLTDIVVKIQQSKH